MEFKRGQRYMVNSQNAGMGQYSRGGINNMEKGFVFVYERKSGKHHIFREVNGGWIRTYTDNQLIGKKIEEAQS